MSDHADDNVIDKGPLKESADNLTWSERLQFIIGQQNWMPNSQWRMTPAVIKAMENRLWKHRIRDQSLRTSRRQENF